MAGDAVSDLEVEQSSSHVKAVEVGELNARN